MGERNNHNCGAILVVVLMVLSIMVTVAVNSLRMIQVDMTGSRAFAQRIQGRLLAEAGIEFAKAVLISDAESDSENKRVDHLGEPWSKFLDQEDVELPQPQTGKLKGSITDEQSKFPVHFLINDEGAFRNDYKQVLTNLLQAPPFELGHERVQTILQSLKDWIDKDNITSGPYGAEEDFYQLEGKSYTCRNGSMLSLGELCLVRGVDKALYYGRSDKPGLKDFLTLFGSGRININTAPQPILTALIKRQETGISVQEARDFASKMISFREKEMHWDLLSESQWYSEVSGALSFHLYPVTTIQSSFFSADIQAETGTTVTKSFSVLERKEVSIDEEKAHAVEIKSYEAL